MNRNEVLSLKARRKLAMRSKKNLKRAAKKRKIKMKRKRSSEELMKTAERQAKNILKKKLLKKLPADMTPMDKLKFSQKIEKKRGLVQKVTKKILPKVKQQETERIKSLRKRKTKNTNRMNEMKFSKKQLDTLRDSYSQINKIDPTSPTHDKLVKFLDRLDNNALKQIAGAKIKFLSILAKSRIKESIEEIDEYDVETIDEMNDFIQFMKEYKSDINEAEYQGRDVKLGKIMQGDVKKFKVYVKNDKGNVVKVNFGQKGMNIKKDNPDARKSFRARHNCDNPGPRWKARYWSCRKW